MSRITTTLKLKDIEMTLTNGRTWHFGAGTLHVLPIDLEPPPSKRRALVLAWLAAQRGRLAAHLMRWLSRYRRDLAPYDLVAAAKPLYPPIKPPYRNPTRPGPAMSIHIYLTDHNHREVDIGQTYGVTAYEFEQDSVPTPITRVQLRLDGRFYGVTELRLTVAHTGGRGATGVEATCVEALRALASGTAPFTVAAELEALRNRLAAVCALNKTLERDLTQAQCALNEVEHRYRDFIDKSTKHDSAQLEALEAFQADLARHHDGLRQAFAVTLERVYRRSRT